MALAALGGRIPEPAPIGVDVAVVTTDRDLDALGPEWRELSARSGATVFQTYEWLRPWWTHFGAGRTLHCLVFRAGDGVVGITPLAREPVRLCGVPVATRLRVLGSPHSGYYDLIVRPGYERLVCDRFAAYLRSTAEEWDVLDVQGARQDAVACAILPARLARHGIPVRAHSTLASRVALPRSWDAFLEGLGRNGRRNFKRKLRRLRQDHRVEIEVYREDTEDLPDAIEAFARIHERRWRSLGYPNTVADRAFYVDVARSLARRGWLALSFLKVDGLRVAVSFDVCYRDRVYVYLAHAYGPDEVMAHSPGFLLMCMAAQRAIAEGRKVYDLLTGNEAYKLERFKAVEAPIRFIRATSPAHPGRARVFAACELASKGRSRIVREYYDLKRFVRTQRPSPWTLARSAAARAGALGRLAVEHLRRNLR